MIAETATYPCSDQIGLLMLEGAREIIGQAGVNAVLNRAQALCAKDAKTLPGKASADAIQRALEDLYGQRGGQGVALRSGRASFGHLLRVDGKEMGLMELNYRMLPSKARIFMGLQLLAKKISELTGNLVQVDEENEAWLWSMDVDPQSNTAAVNRNNCHFIIGFLQEYLLWASGGKFHHVQEVQCAGEQTQACLIRLEKAEA